MRQRTRKAGSQKPAKTKAAAARHAAKGSIGGSNAAVAGTDMSGAIRKEIWPNEPQILFRPDRLRYVRKMLKPEGCVFCSALQTGVSSESLLLRAGRHAIVVMNKYPYNTGHVLILPRRHCGDFLELKEAEHAEMNACLRDVISALQSEYQPAGFNVGLNLGSVAGAGIPEHLHYHVIPRWAGDTNFFPLIAETKVVVENLETTFARLLPYFSPDRMGAD